MGLASRDANVTFNSPGKNMTSRDFAMPLPLYTALTNPVVTRGPDAGPPNLYTIVPMEVSWLGNYLQAENYDEDSATFTLPSTYVTQDISAAVAQADIYVVDSGFWIGHDVSYSAIEQETAICELID
jgi:hypothetical protein